MPEVKFEGAPGDVIYALKKWFYDKFIIMHIPEQTPLDDRTLENASVLTTLIRSLTRSLSDILPSEDTRIALTLTYEMKDGWLFTPLEASVRVYKYEAEHKINLRPG